MDVIPLLFGFVYAIGIVAAALDGNNDALVEECVRNTHSLIKQPTGVIAQVKHNALDAAGILGFLLSGFKGVAQFFGSALRKTREPNPVIPVFKLLGLHADKRNGIAHKADSLRGLGIAVQDGQLHLRAFGAANTGDDFLQRELLRGLPVDGQNNIARLEPGPVRRGVLDGGDHRNLAVFH